jgi:sarcosine oxidase gamma subunit
MDEPLPLHAPLAHAGLIVSVDEALGIAALRYFDRAGRLAAAAREATGSALPQTLEAITARDGELILAWRSPSETWCLTGSAPLLAQLATQLAGVPDGCLVDLSGGLKVVRVRGERIPELLCRLGGTACVPQPGEARRGRLADLPVLALSVRTSETLLVVDRAYLPHLLGWIRETLLDLAAAG